jgi:hypothetical protein
VIVHTIGIQPPARGDDVAWSQVRIEQSATEAGSYTTTTTIALEPDINPRGPSRLELTFTSSLADGWFRFVFIDPAGNASDPTDPIQDGGSGIDWAPAVADVAALIRARTKDDAMNELGTFTTATRPTAAEVAGYIVQAVDAVVIRVGAVRDALKPRAQELAALYAAMLIELSYWPEQIRENRSPYDSLKALFDEGMAALYGAVIDEEPARKGIFSIPLHSDIPLFDIPPMP